MKDITGTTAVCGLIGHPVSHTLSPLIHNTLSQLLGIELVYVPFEVAPERVKEAVEGAYALNIKGLNVTVPHKSAVIPYLSDIDPLAEKIGAVNTLVRTADGYKGYNTDMPGLYRELQSEGVEIAGRDVILLGAGGVSRAVAFLCAQYGANRVYILNRTIEKAQEIAKEVNQSFGRECLVPMMLSAYREIPEGKYPVIQGTSVGLAPHEDQAVIEDPEFYKLVETGVDLIYRPAQTKFMKLAKAAGAQAYNGLKMLLYQGIIAYELWNEIRVSEEMAGLVYQKMKEALGIYEE
ncbi:MAG: shikimate dehydrogenase [Lachnospiraceae bacterium]